MKESTKNKIIKIVIIVIIMVGFGFTVGILIGHKFKNGWCVKDNRDGYVWQINDFRSDKYHVMGWQDNAWGNSVEIEKDVLERKVQGIQVYNQTACPEFVPK